MSDVVAKALREAKYQYAKTMPWCPHWYTLKKTWEDPELFEYVVQYIRDNGYKERFYKKVFTRLDVNDMKYWSMGAPIPDTILINRAFIEEDRPSAYDKIAACYDDLHTDEDSKKENDAVFKSIKKNESDSVLDIGCGTGLFLDYHKCIKEYLGIDPSYKMLDRFKAKHQAETIRSTFESFYTERKFSLIICLFGAANYIKAKAIQRIPDFLATGGRYFVMFYKPGYAPVTYKKSGVSIEHEKHDISILPGEISEIGNFHIVKGQA